MEKKEKNQESQNFEEVGAGEEIRTPDQRLGKPMRYHCATPAQSYRKEFILGRAQNASQG